jgi:type IV secretion system protein VirD4
VRKGPDEVRDVQNIADILVDPEGALERRSHWEKTYRDRPAPHRDDWGGQVRGLDRRPTAALDAEARAGQPEEGGLQRQRYPGLPEKDVTKPNPEPAVGLGLDDGSDTVADAQVMDRSRGLGAVGRAHAINEGEPQRRPGRDLLPEF